MESTPRRLRRHVQLVVISDVHLGTRGARAEELLEYLKSISPDVLVLNGDIVDMWQFSRHYWPTSHTRVIKQILSLSAKGTRVIYLTGNHDERLRRFSGLTLGNFELRDQLSLSLDSGERVWLFHGDVFDAVMQNGRWLARIGAVSYDLLIALNVAINGIRRACGFGPVSLSKRIKNNVKSAVSFINNFEETAAGAAAARDFDTVVCGHIHQPADRLVHLEGKSPVRYLNSGDWVENLTALEHHRGQWRVYDHDHRNEDLTAHWTTVLPKGDPQHHPNRWISNTSITTVAFAEDDDSELDDLELSDAQLLSRLLAELQAEA